MTRVSDFQLNQVVHIGHLAQECVAEKDFAQIMTRELMDLLHACSGVFIEYDPGSPTNELLCGTSYQVDHSNMKKYLDYYQFLDPTLPRFRLMSRSHESASVSTDQVIESDLTYEECEFYQDFLRPTRVHAAMIFGVNIDGRQFGLVGLHRTKPMGHFSEVDHKLTQLLIPYLSMALRFRYSQRQQQRRDDVVTNLLRVRGIRGYLMLDQNFVLRDVVGEFESPDLVVKGADLQRMRGCSVFQFLSPSVKESLLRRRTTAAAPAVEITHRRDPYRVEVVQALGRFPTLRSGCAGPESLADFRAPRPGKVIVAAAGAGRETRGAGNDQCRDFRIAGHSDKDRRELSDRDLPEDRHFQPHRAGCGALELIHTGFTPTRGIPL